MPSRAAQPDPATRTATATIRGGLREHPILTSAWLRLSNARRFSGTVRTVLFVVAASRVRRRRRYSTRNTPAMTINTIFVVIAFDLSS